MTGIIAVPGVISSRDATLIKAVVAGLMPEICSIVREATEPLLVRIAELEQRELLLPEKGEPGERGAPGVDGKDGRDGANGNDGVGLADALIDKDGSLILTMTDGRTKSLGQIGGKDGRDGRDGVTPTFIDAEFVGRTLRLKFDDDRACEFQLATPEYCGVFKEGAGYEPGDIVTWAGSAWHCDESKGLKPGAPDSGWTLMVKAGRPGKDAGK